MGNNTMLSGLRISRAGMAAHMRASKRYQHDHALPDSIGLADIARADPARLLDAIVCRACEERLPRSRVTLRWPKGFDRSSYRLFTSLDTIDQLAYRLLVSPVANCAASRLPPTVVAHASRWPMAAGGRWVCAAGGAHDRQPCSNASRPDRTCG